MLKQKPLSNNCPYCGVKLDLHHSEEDKEKNIVNVWVCNNPYCKNQEQYQSFRNN